MRRADPYAMLYLQRRGQEIGKGHISQVHHRQGKEYS